MQHVVFRDVFGERQFLRDMQPMVMGDQRPVITTHADQALKLTLDVAIMIAEDMTRTNTGTPWRVKAANQ